MERTENFKKKFNFFRKNNFNKSNKPSSNLNSNQVINSNSNQPLVQNHTTPSNIDQKICALINQPELINQEDQVEQKQKQTLNSNPVENKKDFSISYKDKAYTYVIPENILKKEMNSIPFWLLPIQVKLIQNGNEMQDFCNEILSVLSKTGARIEIDNKQENIQKKIKNAEFDKIPYIIIIGPREKSIHKFIVRTIDGNQKLLSVGAFSHILEDQLLNKPKSKLQ